VAEAKLSLASQIAGESVLQCIYVVVVKQYKGKRQDIFAIVIQFKMCSVHLQGSQRFRRVGRVRCSGCVVAHKVQLDDPSPH
jgi:hypothetical protein